MKHEFELHVFTSFLAFSKDKLKSSALLRASLICESNVLGIIPVVSLLVVSL